MVKICNNCGFNQNEFLEINGKAHCKSCDVEINNLGGQQQEQITLSADSVMRSYNALYGGLEDLERYLERAYPDWVQKKQLPNTVTRPDVSEWDGKEARGWFQDSLLNINVMVSNDPRFISEELQVEFLAWLDNSAIKFNDCPEELKQDLIDFHSVLTGNGEKFANRRFAEAEREIDNMAPEVRKKVFSDGIVGIFKELEKLNKKYEAVKNKTYQDVKLELGGKFSGDAKEGLQVFSQITGKTFNLDDSNFSLLDSRRQIQNSKTLVDDSAKELVKPTSPTEDSKVSELQPIHPDLIDEIKRNPNQWRIELLNEEPMLIRHDAKVEYNSGNLTPDSKKLFNKGAFSESEWAEIERVLSQQLNSQYQTQTKNSYHREGKEKLGGYGNSIMFGSFTVISLIGLAFIR